MIVFGEYLPDVAPLENPGLTVCENVLPGSAGYEPIPSPSPYGLNPLDTRPLGGITARDGTTNSVIYTFIGTAAKLYQLDGATFTDVSIGGGYATANGERWEFVIWGSQVVATNFSNVMQVKSLAAGGNFANLGGSPPQARHMDIVGEFLVVGNTYDAVDLYQPARVRWAGIGTITSWTVSASTQADFQDLRNDGGQIQRIIGGEFGLIFQQKCITRMSYVGAPLVFQFDLVESQRGAVAPGSVIKVGNNVAYLAEDGFFVFDGQQSIPIGDGKVDSTFFADVDRTHLDRMSVALYPNENIICWSYASLDAENGMPDRILMYNYSPNSKQKWSYANINTWFIMGPISQSYTLDGLDAVSTNIDALPFPPPDDISLDSPVWMGVITLLATFDEDLYLNLLNGSPLDATIVTGEGWLQEPNRTYVTLVRPHIERNTGAVTVQIGCRNLESENVSFGAAATLNSAGYAPVRANARLLRARFNISGDFDDAQGFDIITTTSSGRR